MSDRGNMPAMGKLYELSRLRTAGCDQGLCQEQRKCYLEHDEFYRQHSCRTSEEAAEIINGTPFLVA